MPALLPPWTKTFPASRKPIAWLRYTARRIRLRILKLRDPRLVALKDKYKGQRCFILGNGPSLMKRDMSALKNEVTFGANALFKHFDELGFKTTFWSHVDITYTEDWWNEINAFKGVTKFVAFKNCFGYELGSSDIIVLNSSQPVGPDPDVPEPRFSTDATDHVYHSNTVTYIALQLAYHMGFSEVYLVGVDHDYGILPDLFPTGKPIITAENIEMANSVHFGDSHYKIGDRMGIPKFHFMEAGYRLARAEFEADGRRVVNATEGGKLEIFERESLDDVLARLRPAGV